MSFSPPHYLSSRRGCDDFQAFRAQRVLDLPQYCVKKEKKDKKSEDQANHCFLEGGLTLALHVGSPSFFFLSLYFLCSKQRLTSACLPHSEKWLAAGALRVCSELGRGVPRDSPCNSLCVARSVHAVEGEDPCRCGVLRSAFLLCTSYCLLSKSSFML